MTQDLKNDPTQLFCVVNETRREVLARFRQDQPDLYQQAIGELGQEEGEDVLLTAIIRRMLETRSYVPDPQSTWHIHLKAASFERFALLLCQYHWTWLHSPHGYVIGDNPPATLARGQTAVEFWHRQERCSNQFPPVGSHVPAPWTRPAITIMGQSCTVREHSPTSTTGGSDLPPSPMYTLATENF